MKIAVVPGDGIGPEIVREGLRALKAVASLHGLDLSFEDIDASADRYRRTGVAIEEEAFRRSIEADAIYLGAIGLPEVRFADGTEVNGAVMLRWRRVLDLYANVRPLRSFAGVPSYYATRRDVDLIVVREGTEGLYASQGAGAFVADRVVSDTMITTRAGVERVSRFSFELARRSPPRNGRKAKVTLLDKANILRGWALWRRVFDEVAREFPDVESERLYADAASMLMTQHPEDYHVVVAENFLGDLFSDLAAAYVGGLGMAPSGEIGEGVGLFQPSHGSAPTIAGKNVANPTATILSGSMMLSWWATKSKDARFEDAAGDIERAVAAALADPANHTPDLGGSASTSALGSAVVNALTPAVVRR